MTPNRNRNRSERPHRTAEKMQRQHDALPPPLAPVLAGTGPTDEALRPYGYAPGKFKRWCAACGEEKPRLGEKAFKCLPCAVNQWKAVERLSRAFFEEDGDQ